MPAKSAKTNDPPFINRELSWLEFNQRVLNEAARGDLPLLERLKFLAITASNLDEFFQVRVGGLMLMRRSRRNTPDPSGLTPTANLAAIRQRVLRMIENQYSLLNQDLLPALASHGIRLLTTDEVDPARAAHMAGVFEDTVFPLLTPLAVQSGGEPPVVPAMQMVVACRLSDTETRETRHALIPIPDTLPRCVPLPVDDADSFEFLLIENLVTAHAAALFPGEKITAATAFRVTRNGDIAVQEEDAIDLAGEMEDVLTARR